VGTRESVTSGQADGTGETMTREAITARTIARLLAARPDSPPDLASLCEHLLGQGLSTRKLPEQLQIVAALPRNAMGKVVKRDLTVQFTPKETK
jgi:non-ribosomal peptide synthetase component E (peptide arylation enzyme)